MKYIKQYETTEDDITKDELKLYDYVICEDAWIKSQKEKGKEYLEVNNIIENNMGLYIQQDDKIYTIKYDGNIIPDYVKKFFSHNGSNTRNFYRDEIIHFSPNKEELEQKLLNQKYNI